MESGPDKVKGMTPGKLMVSGPGKVTGSGAISVRSKQRNGKVSPFGPNMILILGQLNCYKILITLILLHRGVNSNINTRRAA